ncbi:DNA cytosine methyltransferase [Ideonella paludis]|uniref:Cytosine-specific methyltransferase n=2 Tax=Ideonella paludis TaxID=1233411 RepID=A0ABS5DSI7_9BURK|nr:DNA cytosine methyltransferase [Ideonella paludis]MBQ0934065.1 DNA cytosine methyltransferase [Ideonella paludis]
MPKRQYKVVSLFSGAMGLDIGLESTGRFKTLAAVELRAPFCETIRANRDAGRTSSRKMKVYEGDIRELSAEQLMDDLGIKPGELDLLVGGPPCQSFSTTGRRGTVQDPRGTLLWDFLRFVEVLQPKFFLMENVRGLVSAAIRHRPIAERPDKGGAPLEADELPGSVLRKFVADLRASTAADYRMDVFEVNAVNYGAPQLRERVLFIGNRFGKVVEFPAPTHGQSDGLKPMSTLRDVIGGLHELSPTVLDFSPRKKSFLAQIPPGGNWRALPENLQKESMGKAWFAKGGRSGWWRRLSFDLPSPTILTMPNHASTALCHPEQLRALTLRECALIQEFPPAWTFCGTAQEQYAQVGNAVPTRLGLVAGQVLAHELDRVTAPAKIQKAGSLHDDNVRIVYLQSHVRTRKWFKKGQAVLWADGDGNADAHHTGPVTSRRVRSV